MATTIPTEAQVRYGDEALTGREIVWRSDSLSKTKFTGVMTANKIPQIGAKETQTATPSWKEIVLVSNAAGDKVNVLICNITANEDLRDKVIADLDAA